MDLLNLIKHPKQAKRFKDIINILIRYSMADWFAKIQLPDFRDIMSGTKKKTVDKTPLPVRLRLALTEMGPTFIKLGQVLSTREDLVGPDVAYELRKLQADTPADPAHAVIETITEEFGKAPDDIFDEFDPVAFSSASIGQVHKARLADGQMVVVKVQHQGIQEIVELDLGILEIMAALLQKHVPDARAYQPEATTREFRRTLLKELDFYSERRNMELFTRNFAGDPSVRIPIIYRDLSGRRVLTMELLQGIPGSRPEKLREAGYDLNAFAKTAANAFLNMIFRDGFYHADPHPGNFMVLEGAVLGLLDCGMVGRIDDSLRELFEDLLLFLMQGDSEGLADLLLRAGSAPVDVDRAGFRSDIGYLLIEYGTQSLDEFDVGGALNQLTDIIRRYKVIMPSTASLLLKTLVMLEGTSRLVSPAFSLAELLEPFKEKLIQQRMSPGNLMRRMQRSFRDVDRLIRQGPRNLSDILDRLQAGELKVKHEHRNLEKIAGQLVAGLLIASLFMGSSLLLSTKVPPLFGGFSVVGVLGCLVGVVYGARLYHSIKKRL